MSRIALGIALLAAGCATAQPGGGAREAFEQWNRAVATKDIEASFRGLSISYKSHWLWRLMQDTRDQVTQAHLATLEPGLRKLLDTWFQINEKEKPQRAEVLPAIILDSRWFLELYRIHFAPASDDAAAQAVQRQVAEVYSDDSGVTIVTDIQGNLEMYGLIFEGGGWKIESHRTPPRRRG